MSEAIDVDAHEVIEILEPGYCLIEMPDRGRFIARMQSGSVTGPMRIMQIEEFDVDALQANPVPTSKALAIVPGETLKEVRTPVEGSAPRAVLLRAVLPAGSVLMGAALLVAGIGGDITSHEAMIACALGAANLAFGTVIALIGLRRRAGSPSRPGVAERAAEARKRRASPPGGAVPA
ncbi:hypothetical protein [Paracoccus sp. ME4]|uniref:hypothetical protein n=1 Tax=Paracoccus sp. ME4 TaxID=3138066 RepID=UPI00398BBB2A